MSKENNYSVISRLDAIGDFILWLDAAKALIAYEKQQGNSVILICQKCNMQIASKYLSDIKVIGITYGTLTENEESLLKEIKCKNLYQCVFNNTKYIDYVAQLIQSNVKIAMKGNTKIYSVLYGVNDEWIHEYLKNMQFVKKIINADFQVAEHEKYNKENYFVVAPYTSIKKKNLDEKKYIKIMEYILSKTEWKCIMLGNEGQTILGKLYDEQQNSSVINLLGKTNIIEYIDIISKANLVIGNDSSCIHIAAYNNVDSIAITGGSSWRKFLPYPSEMENNFKKPLVVCNKMKCYGCNYEFTKRSYNCLKTIITGKAFPCVEDITFEKVKENIDYILKYRCK